MKHCSICGCFLRKVDNGCSRCEREKPEVWVTSAEAVFTQLSERQQELADMWRVYLHKRGLLKPMLRTIRGLDIPKMDDPILDEIAAARDLLGSALGTVKDRQARRPMDSEIAAFKSLRVYLRYMSKVDIDIELRLLWAIELADLVGNFVSNDEDQRMHATNWKEYWKANPQELLPKPIGSDWDNDVDGDVQGDGLARGDGLVKNLQLQSPAGTLGKKSPEWKLGLTSIWVQKAKFEWSFRRPVRLLKSAVMSIIHELNAQLDHLEFEEGTGLTQFIDLDTTLNQSFRPFEVTAETTKNPGSPIRFFIPIKLIVKRAYTMARGDDWRNPQLAKLWDRAEKISQAELDKLKDQDEAPTLNNGLTPDQLKEQMFEDLREHLEHYKLWAREHLKSLAKGRLDRVGDMVRMNCGHSYCPVYAKTQIELFKLECDKVDGRVTSTLHEVLSTLKDIQQYDREFTVTVAAFGPDDNPSNIQRRYKQALGLPVDKKSTTSSKSNGLLKLKGEDKGLAVGQTTVTGDDLASLSVF